MVLLALCFFLFVIGLVVIANKTITQFSLWTWQIWGASEKPQHDWKCTMIERRKTRRKKYRQIAINKSETIFSFDDIRIFGCYILLYAQLIWMCKKEPIRIIVVTFCTLFSVCGLSFDVCFWLSHWTGTFSIQRCEHWTTTKRPYRNDRVDRQNNWSQLRSSDGFLSSRRKFPHKTAYSAAVRDIINCRNKSFNIWNGYESTNESQNFAPSAHTHKVPIHRNEIQFTIRFLDQMFGISSTAPPYQPHSLQLTQTTVVDDVLLFRRLIPLMSLQWNFPMRKRKLECIWLISWALNIVGTKVVWASKWTARSVNFSTIIHKESS